MLDRNHLLSDGWKPSARPSRWGTTFEKHFGVYPQHSSIYVAIDRNYNIRILNDVNDDETCYILFVEHFESALLSRLGENYRPFYINKTNLFNR
jgi:hypothetical protein